MICINLYHSDIGSLLIVAQGSVFVSIKVRNKHVDILKREVVDSIVPIDRGLDSIFESAWSAINKICR